MFNKLGLFLNFRVLIVVVSSYFLAGCVTAGVMKENEQFRISKVVVTKANPKFGTANLVEDIRVKTVREASKHPQGGSKKILRVDVDNFHFKNAALSLITGDSNRLSAKVSLIDVATNRVDGTFDVRVQDSGMINGWIGLALAAGDKPSSAERRLTTLLARHIMVNIYGSERAQKAASRAPTASPKGNYPSSYKEIDRIYECKKSVQFKDENDVMGENKPPAHCR